jgi:hypothetical protein
MLSSPALGSAIALAVVGYLVMVNWPEPKREPVCYSAIGAGRPIDTKDFGKFPGDFGGAVWPPRS